MSALWAHGITCFDVDVIRLSGGELIVGHPADIVQLARKSSKSSREGITLTPGLLHRHSLAELRAAGVGAGAAPLLSAIARHFAQLRRSKPISSTGSTGGTIQLHNVPVSQAAAERSFRHVPVLSLELKGPAAYDIDAWKEVVSTAESAGVTDAAVLWLRHQFSTTGAAGSSNSSDGGQSPVVRLAQSIKRSNMSSSRGSSSRGTGAGVPLVGLVVGDQVMKLGVLDRAATNAQ